jgi:hypothetical protein
MIAREGYKGNQDAFVMAFDTSGRELWRHEFGSLDRDFAKGITAGTGGVFVSGWTDGAINGTGTQDSSAFIAKYRRSGDPRWVHEFGTPGEDLALGSASSAANEYVVGTTSGRLPHQGPSGGWDAFIRAWDPTGHVLWTREFGTRGFDELRGAAVGHDEIFVVGDVTASLSGLPYAGGYDAIVRAFDPNGTALWTDEFGETYHDLAYAAASTPTGVLVAGYSSGELPGATVEGGTDLFLRSYTASGTVSWTTQFAIPNPWGFGGFGVRGTDNYVSGWTGGSFPGQLSYGKVDAFFSVLA